MKSRAAIHTSTGQPLTVDTIEISSPKEDYVSQFYIFHNIR